MEFIEKLAIANAYITKHTESLEWDDLADINSLHDCDTEKDIFAACKERLKDSGFLVDSEDMSEEEPIIEDIDDIIMSDDDEDDDILLPDID